MNIADLDVRTIISLLFVGNSIQLIILLFFRTIAEHRRSYSSFLAGKILQSIAWLLLSLRDSIPVLFSAYLGNVLLLSGIAFEVYALTTLRRKEKHWGIIFGSIVSVGCAAFCILGVTPSLWVGYASLTAMSLFLPSAAALVMQKSSSPMRKIIGLFYGIVALTLAVRAWDGFFAATQFTLMSHNLINVLSFSAIFLVLIVSGTGFLMMLKESADWKILESETKYRTLVENANEAICIIQEQRVAFANEKTCELLGVTPEQLLGRPFMDFIYADDLAMVVTHYTDRVSGKEAPKAYTFRVVTKEGKPTWVLNSARMIDYGGEQAVMALMTNIDKLKSMEQEKELMIGELRQALADVKTLTGLLPICASCKKIRNDQGYWEQLERFIIDHSDARFTHGLCPECAGKWRAEGHKLKK